MGKTNYGIISDLHYDPRIVPFTIDTLKELGIDKFIVNGDIEIKKNNLKDRQDILAYIFDSFKKSNIDTYVIPGSHETLLGFGQVLEFFSDKYDNIFDCSRISHIKNNNHSIAFLPGSDIHCGGDYFLGNINVTCGRYIITEKSLIGFDDISHYIDAINKGFFKNSMQYANIDRLEEIITDPDKTVVFCHVPRLFDNLENCVDSANFIEVRTYIDGLDGYKVKGIIPQSNFNIDFARNEKTPIYLSDEHFSEENIEKEMKDIIKKDNKKYQDALIIKSENRGNKFLKDIYERIGIKKAVSGHFHESGHRANDSYGNHIPEERMVSELFWNNGYLDMGQAGILTVEDEKVSYRNVNLKDFLK
jgi:hypothetical protein